VHLVHHLKDRVEFLRSSAIAIEPATISCGADRWLMASLLQKAIRRGQPQMALAAALTLLEMDQPRLWRRLMTVALEDIGVGALDVALDLTAISASAVARRLLGGSRAALEIVIPLACRAVKDRTADHLASLVRHGQSANQAESAGSWPPSSSLLRHGQSPDPGEGAKASGKDHPDAAASVTSFLPSFAPFAHEPPDGSMSALYGPVPPGDAVALSAPAASAWSGWQDHLHTAAAFGQAWELDRIKVGEILEYFQRRGAPEALLEGCGCHASRSGDGLFIQALIAWQIWQEAAPEPVALARTGLEGQQLGGIPDYALDPLHTRLGRRVTELWLRSYLEKPPFASRQVAAALWNAEAAVCNQTLFWQVGGQIQTAAYSADLTAQGLCPSRHREIFAWLAQERSVLTAARQMVWQSHIRASQEICLGQP
jgi:hypothetical protein